MSEKRYVKTAAGAKRFGKPIGSLITESVGDSEAPQKVMTLERLSSLIRLYLQAKKYGNISRMKEIQAEFSEGIRTYGDGDLASNLKLLYKRLGAGSFDAGVRGPAEDI